MENSNVTVKVEIQDIDKLTKPGMMFFILSMVKYSPPIEAGASFNPPNLAEDFILRASVSEAMGFL